MRTSSISRGLSALGRLWRDAIPDARTHHHGFEELRRTVESHGVQVRPGVMVLEIGCGHRAPLALQFATAGAECLAIDVVPVTLGLPRRPIMWWRRLRIGGPVAAAKALLTDLVHTWRYWRELQRLSGRPLPFGRVEVMQTSAAALPFPDQSFDIIVSSAVWEHIDDVESATSEVARLLRPNGLAVIGIHLFPSLSGGHDPDWRALSVKPLSARTQPWQHLREDPDARGLNGWTEGAYREVFERHLNVIEWVPGAMVGEELLLPSIEAEFPQYTQRDFLLESVRVVARTRKAPPASAVQR